MEAPPIKNIQAQLNHSQITKQTVWDQLLKPIPKDILIPKLEHLTHDEAF